MRLAHKHNNKIVQHFIIPLNKEMKRYDNKTFSTFVSKETGRSETTQKKILYVRLY